jgi:Family of unknown function (DUF6159)
MFQKLSNSWELMKASARVLAADKQLVIFPLLSALALLVVTASFIVPVVLVEGSHLSRGSGALGLGLAFLFYVVAYFIVFFANSALVGAALVRLRGGEPTVAEGFRIASDRLVPIVGYALAAATVGVVLRAIQERAGLLGRVVVSLMGTAWSLATFMVVPVLVSEDLGPVDAVKRSTQLLKQTWGEQVVGNFAVGTVVGLAGLVLTLVFVPLVALAAASGSVALIATSVGGYVLSLALLMLVNATLSGIYTAALYRYAAEGTVGGGFDDQMVQGAFRPK